MIEHLFSHLLPRKIERRVDDWVAAGQRAEAISALDGAACHLAFGFRYRLQSLLVYLGFGAASIAFCRYWFTAQHVGILLVLAYACFIFPTFLLSAFLTLSAYTTRITISTKGIVVRRFGIGSARVHWSKVCEVYRSSVTPDLMFVACDRRRVRVSTQLDGVRAIPLYLQHVTPSAVDRSIVEWMIDLYRCPDCRTTR